ncbi:hypothetical protein ACOZ38_03345 [Sphaerisporangium viridialbum]|uniref:hypothetical protein n=1 Tax=Sphaerisporangium viridialbum TaxID=46189 RepID=UPI003C72581A
MLALIPAITKDLPGRPDPDDLRKVLREYALLPEDRRRELPAEHAPVLRWLETASLPLVGLKEPRVVRMGLDAISVTFKGQKAVANTVLRKREVLGGCAASYGESPEGDGVLMPAGGGPSHRRASQVVGDVDDLAHRDAPAPQMTVHLD